VTYALIAGWVLTTFGLLAWAGSHGQRMYRYGMYAGWMRGSKEIIEAELEADEDPAKLKLLYTQLLDTHRQRIDAELARD